MEEFCYVQGNEDLIGKKFYKTSDIAQNKLDVFFAANRLTEEEYLELSAMVQDVYSE